jgi:O-antigen/teichoic acid export membrane protein/thymidylate kinase
MNPESHISQAALSPPSIPEAPALEHHPQLVEFSETLFGAMEELNLHYCLLEEPSRDRGALVSSLEIAVLRAERGRFPLLFGKLREKGYMPLQSVPLAANDCRYIFATSTGRGAHFFSLTIREPFPEGLLFTTDRGTLARRRNLGKCWIACETDRFSYLLSKVGLASTATEGQRAELKRLAGVLGPAETETVAARLFGRGIEREVAAACADGRWDGIAERLRARMRRVALRTTGLGCLIYVLLELRCALRRWFRPSGVYLVILGPDGAGKSTLTRKIFEFFGPLFEGQRILQWRPQLLKPRKEKAPWFNPPHTRPPYGSLRSAAHLLAVLLDYWVAYPILIRPLLARTALIVYDRDLHDLLVDRLRYRYGGPGWLCRFAVRLMPEPEAVYLTLDAEPDIILGRKNEVARNELERQRGAYRELAAGLPNSTVVRTDRDIESSNQLAIEAVLKYMAGRFDERERLPTEPETPVTTEPSATPPETPAHPRVVRAFFSPIGGLFHSLAGLKSWVLKGSMAVMDQGLISGSNFLLGIILARYVGAEQYGAYALAFSTFVLLALVHTALWLEPMSVFGPSVYRKTLSQYLGLLLRGQLFAAAAVVILAGSAGTIYLFLREPSHLLSAFLGVAFAAPCVLLFWFARRAFYLQLRPGEALIGAITYSALLCSGFLALGYRHLFSPFSAFLVMGSAALLTSLVLLIRLKPAIRQRSIAPVLTSREVTGRHWTYGKWALVSGLFIWLPWNIFYSVIAHFSGLAETGNFRALLNLAMPMTQTYAAFSLLFISHAARCGHEEGWDAVKAQAWKIAGLYALGSGAYWLPVCLFRNQLVEFLYAGHYPQVAPLVPVVAVASILSGAAMGPTIAIRAMRSPSGVAAIYFGSSVACIVVGIPACWALGITGAVLGILLSSVVAVLTGFWMLCSRKSEVRAPELAAKQIRPTSIIALDQQVATQAEGR